MTEKNSPRPVTEPMGKWARRGADELKCRRETRQCSWRCRSWSRSARRVPPWPISSSDVSRPQWPQATPALLHRNVLRIASQSWNSMWAASWSLSSPQSRAARCWTESPNCAGASPRSWVSPFPPSVSVTTPTPTQPVSHQARDRARRGDTGALVGDRPRNRNRENHRRWHG